MTLIAYRQATDWWRTHPEFNGLPIQAHSVLLQRMRAVLEQTGHQVHIVYAQGVNTHDR